MPSGALSLSLGRLFSLLILDLSLLIGSSLVVLLFDCQYGLVPEPLRFALILFL